MERESTEGGALCDGVGEFCGVFVLFFEDLEMLLLVLGPVLALALAQLEEFLSSALEIELILLVAYDLGEVAMRIAPVEVFNLSGEDCGRASNGRG